MWLVFVWYISHHSLIWIMCLFFVLESFFSPSSTMEATRAIAVRAQKAICFWGSNLGPCICQVYSLAPSAVSLTLSFVFVLKVSYMHQISFWLISSLHFLIAVFSIFTFVIIDIVKSSALFSFSEVPCIIFFCLLLNSVIFRLFVSFYFFLYCINILLFCSYCSGKYT